MCLWYEMAKDQSRTSHMHSGCPTAELLRQSYYARLVFKIQMYRINTNQGICNASFIKPLPAAICI